MNIDESPEDRAFRAEIAHWLAERVVSRWGPDPSFAERHEIDRLLAAAGYLSRRWPIEHGGAETGPSQASILDDECARAGVPRSRAPSRFGTNLLAPALFAHATADQLAEFLPGIRSAETLWCQGFSEPDAGSDLANVRSLLREEGDHFRLTGSKTWTTQAREAHWCFALVRSVATAPRHRNLAFVLFLMDLPGIEVRPIVQLTGEAEFNDVYLNDVKVERQHVLGSLDGGWRVAMTVLGSERSYGQLSRYRNYIGQLARVARMVRNSTSARRPYWEREIGRLAADIDGIRDNSHRIVSLAEAGEDLGAIPSIVKLWWSTTHQSLIDLGRDVAVATDGDTNFWDLEWLRSRAESIYAGTSQIQRNVIADRLLELPRQPQAR